MGLGYHTCDKQIQCNSLLNQFYFQQRWISAKNLENLARVLQFDGVGVLGRGRQRSLIMRVSC